MRRKREKPTVLIRRGLIRLRALKRGARAVRKRKPRDTRMRAFGVRKKRYLFAVPLLALLIVLTVALRFGPPRAHRFRQAGARSASPLMGWAVDAASDPDSVEMDHSLVYATLTWKDFEPEEGVYDFESFEAKNHLDAWWAAGKKLVLRFVMDAPGRLFHADIPAWLREQMGDSAGTYYACDLGRGFSPNYHSDLLSERHGRAIAKLGERYAGQPGLAYVEIGSVGHNGAWTTEGLSGDYGLPLSADMKTWIAHYIMAFPADALIAPEPLTAVKLAGLGLYNENLADEEKTWDWLDTVEFGGYVNGLEMRSMADVSRARACGARLAAGADTHRLFTRGLSALVRRLASCRVSYVSGVSGTETDAQARSGMQTALGEMGYRLWVREAVFDETVRAGYREDVQLTWVNDGAQPFGRDWPVELSLIGDGQVVYRQIAQMDIRLITPGRHTLSAYLDVPYDLAGDFKLALAVLDPATNEPAVPLTMSGPNVGGRSLLGDLTVTR